MRIMGGIKFVCGKRFGAGTALGADRNKPNVFDRKSMLARGGDYNKNPRTADFDSEKSAADA